MAESPRPTSHPNEDKTIEVIEVGSMPLGYYTQFGRRQESQKGNYGHS